jgi:hypothetical protein
MMKKLIFVSLVLFIASTLAVSYAQEIPTVSSEDLFKTSRDKKSTEGTEAKPQEGTAKTKPSYLQTTPSKEQKPADTCEEVTERCPYKKCAGTVFKRYCEWAYNNKHEPPKEIKREKVGRMEKVTYSILVIFDVAEYIEYTHRFECTLRKGHSMRHEGGLHSAHCVVRKDYTQTLEYNPAVMVNPGESRVPTNEDIDTWAKKKAVEKTSPEMKSLKTNLEIRRMVIW